MDRGGSPGGGARPGQALDGGRAEIPTQTSISCSLLSLLLTTTIIIMPVVYYYYARFSNEALPVETSIRNILRAPLLSQR